MQKLFIKKEKKRVEKMDKCPRYLNSDACLKKEKK
jgi:hypothetical protein